MLNPVHDFDRDFTQARAQSRREDEIAMSTGKASPNELQRRNSILPQDFWSKAKIDWNAVAGGTKPHSEESAKRLVELGGSSPKN